MGFRGEEIIARSIGAARISDKFGNVWQYHSRSDRHSKISCWAIMFDLLEHCALLREHVSSGKVAFGINHELRDFKHNRKKNLDLVLCTGRDNAVATFEEYGIHNGVVLDEEEKASLGSLPVLHRASVSNVLVALEAKACMTEHVKALPRLHDELSSSHQTIHGDTSGAIAAGYVLINCADAFVSTDRNRKKIRAGKAEVNVHKQPAVATKTLEAMMKLPRRSNDQENGFDALGISMLRCGNDGTPVVIDTSANAQVPDIVTYASLVKRLAHLYATKFSSI
jgi:hypothetical protein